VLRSGSGLRAIQGAAYRWLQPQTLGEDSYSVARREDADVDPGGLTSPQEAETPERGQRGPLDIISDRAEGLARSLDEAEYTQGGVGQRGKHLSQARPLEIMTILVPPTVFGKVKAVLDLPVVANVTLQAARRDPTRIKAGAKIARLTGPHPAAGRTDFTIHAENDPAMGEVQTLADVVGNVQVEPKPAGFDIVPLFSVTS
jgi:hypothetical protein